MRPRSVKAELAAPAHFVKGHRHERDNEGKTRQERKEQRQIYHNETYANGRKDNAKQRTDKRLR
jgi:hypothetical protein